MAKNQFRERLAKLSPAQRALLEQRLKQMRATLPAEPSIPRRPTRDSPPLSFAQQRLWFLNQLEPESPEYNESITKRLIGSLDVSALEAAVNRIVARHEVLRTAIVLVDGTPQQLIAPSRKL